MEKGLLMFLIAVVLVVGVFLLIKNEQKMLVKSSKPSDIHKKHIGENNEDDVV